jgi:outer membrane protein TolC
LTDFALYAQQKKIQNNIAGIQTENINTELYKLKDRINQLYFGILLVSGQLEQNKLTRKDITTVMSKVEASIKNGTDFRTSMDKLNAELIKADQREIELNNSKNSFMNMLGLFINKQLDANTTFEQPADLLLNNKINRPELKVFEIQKNNALLQKKMLSAKNYPKINLFFQGGIGKPSPVNLFTKDLTPYYITGIRMFWNISGLYTLHKDNLIADNDQKIVEVQERTFLFNTSLSLTQQQSEVTKINQLIESDMKLIQLREAIRTTAEVQLENGVINTNDYLKEVNAVDIARQNLVLHQIQLLQSSYNYNSTSGN